MSKSRKEISGEAEAGRPGVKMEAGVEMEGWEAVSEGARERARVSCEGPWSEDHHTQAPFLFLGPRLLIIMKNQHLCTPDHSRSPFSPVLVLPVSSRISGHIHPRFIDGNRGSEPACGAEMGTHVF